MSKNHFLRAIAYMLSCVKTWHIDLSSELEKAHSMSCQLLQQHYPPISANSKLWPWTSNLNYILPM